MSTKWPFCWEFSFQQYSLTSSTLHPSLQHSSKMFVPRLEDLLLRLLCERKSRASFLLSTTTSAVMPVKKRWNEILRRLSRDPTVWKSLCFTQENANQNVYFIPLYDWLHLQDGKESHLLASCGNTFYSEDFAKFGRYLIWFQSRDKR